MRLAVGTAWRIKALASVRPLNVSHWVGRNMHSTSERKLKAHMATAGHASHTLLWSS